MAALMILGAQYWWAKVRAACDIWMNSRSWPDRACRTMKPNLFRKGTVPAKDCAKLRIAGKFDDREYRTDTSEMLRVYINRQRYLHARASCPQCRCAGMI